MGTATPENKTLLYFSSFVCMGLAVGVIGPVLPTLKRTAAGNSGSGLAPSFIARGVGGLAGSLGGGYLVDHIPGHHVVSGSIVLLASALSTLVVCSSAGQLAAAFGFFDTATGGLQSVNALIVWTVPEKATSALNTLNGCFGVGTLLAPLLPLALGPGNERLSVWLIAIALIPTACAAMSLPSPTRPATGSSRDGGGGPEIEAKRASGNALGGVAGQSDSWRRSALVGLTALFLLMVVGAETTMGAFLVTYVRGMTEAGRLSAAGGAGAPRGEGELLTSAFWVAFTAGRVILVAELALLNAAMTLIVLAPGNRVALWIGALLCGIGLSGCFGGAVGQVQQLVGITGSMSGVFGAGALAGVSIVQLAAARASDKKPEDIMRVIGGASFGSSVFMALIWGIVGGGDFSLAPPDGTAAGGSGPGPGRRRTRWLGEVRGRCNEEGASDKIGDSCESDNEGGEEMGLIARGGRSRGPGSSCGGGAPPPSP